MDDIHVSLLAAKSKVAPVKTVSVPRLELCRTVLLARLLQKLRVDLDYQDIPVYAWTDSRIAIAWLSEMATSWQTFVANRVSEVHSILPGVRWRHVPSVDNPADPASRGVKSSALVEHKLWLHGPLWLSKHSTCWPPESIVPNDPQIELEKSKRFKLAVQSYHVNTTSYFHKLPYIVSSWPKLLTVTSYLFKFLNIIKGRCKAQRPSGLSADHYQRSRIFWISFMQQECFSSELQALKREKCLPNTSSIRKMHPFLDTKGLIRVGGRLQHALLSEGERTPIILPLHRITELLAHQIHLQTLHGGVQLCLRVMRQEYWPIKGRRLFKSIIHRCVTCTKQKAALSQQLMGNFPSVRVRASRPFSQVGVDYAGPILVRTSKGRGHKAHKAYICIFVCLCTHAIHIELVSDYSTASFLAALKRFVSRRGYPTSIYTDIGTNFKGADAELKRLLHAIPKSEVSNYCNLQGISWHFIPPGVPHFGGIWEASVKSVKHHMKRVVGVHTLTFEEYYTLLCLIESCLNSRPLSSMSDDVEDLTTLTPGHFLIGAPLMSIPEPSILDMKESYLSRWKLVQQMQEHFWQRWSTEYLHTLQYSPKWDRSRRNFAIGDLVVIRESNLPPSTWKMGRVVQIHPGLDGKVRVVTLRTAQGQLKRPITQLCLLPVRCEVVDKD